MPPYRARPPAAYGIGLARCFGLIRAPALAVQLAPGVTFAITRLNCTRVQAGRRCEIPPQAACLVTLQLGGASRAELWLAGRPVPTRVLRAGTIQILDLRGGAALRLAGSWDVLAFHVPRALLAAVGMDTAGTIACEGGVADPVLGHIGAAALALMRRPRRPGAAVLRHLALATGAHLLQRYAVQEDEGPGRPRSFKR